MLQKPIYFLAFFLLTSTLFGQNYGYSLFKIGWTFSGIGFFDNEASFIGGKATYTWDSKTTSWCTEIWFLYKLVKCSTNS